MARTQREISRMTLSVFILLIVSVSTAFANRFSLSDIPPIRNKKPIHVALEAGGSADTIIPYLQTFSKATGVPVTTESMVFATLYSKEVVELQGRTGAYDVVVTETSWTNEWKDYLYPLDELAKKYDPEGIEGLTQYLMGHDKGLLRMSSSRDGILRGVPYYTYTMINIYREDVFTNSIEMNAFKKQFGYELAPAITMEQLLDQAKFFTRKKGEKLKGETLKHDIYGLSLMAGRFPHVQDEISAMVWGSSAHWASPVRKNGELVGFQVTEEDKKALKQAFTYYQEGMKYAPPGTENAFWDFATAQFVEGNTMIMPFMYNSLWNWSTDVSKKNPGAKAGASPVVGNRPYTGAFHFAPSQDSRNPEAAYWLLKYIGSYETQKSMINAGWAGTRTDVLTEADKINAVEKQFGWIPSTVMQWRDQSYAINDYLHFNSDAFGKIYDQMTIIGHENATGVRTPGESVALWVKQFSKLQAKYGTLPVVK